MKLDFIDWRAFLARGPLFIGILNLTPDSFSDGGRHASPEAALQRAEILAAKGFRLLDLGAESTRPGAEPLDSATEWQRLEPVLRRLRKDGPPLPISVDTRHPEVAAQALEAGAQVINDVNGFRDPRMLALARESRCGIIAMRSRMKAGRFTMPPYGDEGEASSGKALGELGELIRGLQAEGLDPARIAIDPGFGFGTTFKEDLALWNALPSLGTRLGWPRDQICVGISRKRFCAWHAGRPDLPPEARDEITASLHREAFGHGLRIFRSHAATLRP